MSIFKNMLETETCSHHLFVHHLEQIYHKTQMSHRTHLGTHRGVTCSGDNFSGYTSHFAI